MKLVYIAGRFSGETQWDIAMNVRRAEIAALEVARLGAMPICTHSLGRNLVGVLPEGFWRAGALEAMRRCDAVFLVNPSDVRWSDGTAGEVSVAAQRGQPVLSDLGELKKWLREQSA